MPILADRARVVGGLPDVVTIQEGKVSMSLLLPHWEWVPVPQTLFCLLWYMPSYAMADFTIANTRFKMQPFFPVILIFWAKRQDASLSNVVTCRPLSIFLELPFKITRSRQCSIITTWQMELKKEVTSHTWWQRGCLITHLTFEGRHVAPRMSTSSISVENWFLFVSFELVLSGFLIIYEKQWT